MKIAVVAANGRSGRAFVERALTDGHQIRAGVHSGTLDPRDRLDVMQCDATNEADVRALINGCDAVVSFIGHVKGSPARVQTEAMKVVVRVMQETGVRRIVSLTGTGVRFEGDRVRAIDWFMNTAIAFIDPNRIKDGIEHAEVLKSSGLDWTIVRVLKLQGFKTHPFMLRDHGPTRLYVNRNEVAEAVLQVLDDARFVQIAPIIGKA